MNGTTNELQMKFLLNQLSIKKGILVLFQSGFHFQNMYMHPEFT